MDGDEWCGKDGPGEIRGRDLSSKFAPWIIAVQVSYLVKNTISRDNMSDLVPTNETVLFIKETVKYISKTN